MTDLKLYLLEETFLSFHKASPSCQVAPEESIIGKKISSQVSAGKTVPYLEKLLVGIVINGWENNRLTVFSDSVLSLANREEDSISLSSAIVLSSSDLIEKEDKEEWGKGQDGVIGVEAGEGVTLELVDDR